MAQLQLTSLWRIDVGDPVQQAITETAGRAGGVTP